MAKLFFFLNGVDIPFAGVTTGGIWGLYWFPSLTGTTLPANNFQIGGFTQASNTITGSFGDIGTVIPADGNTSSTIFADSIVTSPDPGLQISRFTAIVAIPEPTTLTLSALGALALLRRRRN
ncbi:MAG: PEP-CTERM sorting domain-containing protein [Akkermansiaceae bacterium]|nr:PEP-CTERM sorting domain-containing protein [Akkermansiaceae bacterium]